MTCESILSTKRTVVNRVSLNDDEFFLQLMNSPGWLRNIGDRGITELDDARCVIREAYLQSYVDHGFGYYVIKANASRMSMGIAGFLKKPSLNHPDFGFAMLPDYQGKGLAFEACTAILQYGVSTFGFKILDAVTRPDNLNSIRLLKQLNFYAHGTTIAENTTDKLMLFRWRS